MCWWKQEEKRKRKRKEMLDTDISQWLHLHAQGINITEFDLRYIWTNDTSCNTLPWYASRSPLELSQHDDCDWGFFLALTCKIKVCCFTWSINLDNSLIKVRLIQGSRLMHRPIIVGKILMWKLNGATSIKVRMNRFQTCYNISSWPHKNHNNGVLDFGDVRLM